MGGLKGGYAQPGSLDTTFSADGILTTDIGSSNDYGQSVAIQSDGKIVVAGFSNNGTNDDFAVVRYNTDDRGEVDKKTRDSKSKLRKNFTIFETN